MTPTRLREVGEALYGERWQSSLARALGIAPRTLRRWMDERGTHRWLAQEWPIPPWVTEELDTLLRERGAKIRALLGA